MVLPFLKPHFYLKINMFFLPAPPMLSVLLLNVSEVSQTTFDADDSTTSSIAIAVKVCFPKWHCFSVSVNTNSNTISDICEH